MLHSFAHEKPVGPLQVRKYYLHFRNQKTEAQRHLLVQSHRANGKQTWVPSFTVLDSKAWLLIIIHNLHMVFIPYVLACCGYCNYLPQTCWLKAAESNSLTVIEARSLKSRSQQGHTPSRGSRRESFPCLLQFLGAANIPWLMAASL